MANTTKQTNRQIPSQSSPSNVLALQWNLLGLRGRLPELQLLISQFNPIALALQETMVPKSKIPSNFIKGYELYICENLENPDKTGSAIAIKSDIPHRCIDISTPLQAIAIEIDFPFKVTLVSIYISPSHQSNQANQTLKSRLSKILDRVTSPILLMGDFNGHSTSWGSVSSDSRGRTLEQFIDEYGLTLLNDGSQTRISPSSGESSALDLSICSHNLGSQLSWLVHDDCCGSDHLPIVIALNRASPITSCRPRWRYELADWAGYQNEVFTHFNSNPPSCPDEFVKCLSDIAEHHIPKTNGRPGKRSVPWWNPEVHSAIKLRRKKLRALQRMAKGDRKDSSVHLEFKAARNAARTAIIKAKQDGWEQFISSINPESTSKEMWDKVHKLSGNKSRQPIRLRINNQITDDPSLIAEHLADHFAQSSSSDNYSEQFKCRKTTIESTSPSFATDNNLEYNSDFSYEELEWALHKVHGTSAGPDDVGYPLLKNLPLIGKSILLDLFNKIWNNGIIPESWKEGLVIPIPKPDKDRNNADSYRPITLLNCIGKILEKMVNRRLITLLESQGLLDNRQFAFRPNKSTDDYLTELEDIIDSHLERGMHGDIVSLDLSKAYDRAWRFPILKSLEEWGIKGRMGQYVHSFLEDRRFRVNIGNNRSEMRCQENGIPQGSVIAPTLFLICMQSLFKNIPPNVYILIYADDITILTFHSFKSLARKRIQSAVNTVAKWANEYGFTLSPEKSQLLHISHNRKKMSKLPDITLNHSTIKSKPSLKILGVYLDQTLSFRHHAEAVRKTTEKRLRLIKIIGSRIPCAHRTTIIRIINSWLIPKMFYGIGLFSRGGDIIKKKLSPLYNKAFRYASGVFITSPISAMMSECGQLPFDQFSTTSVVTKAIRWLSLGGRDDVPLVKRALTLFQSLTNLEFPSIATLPRSKTRPWNQPSPKIDLSLLQLVKAGDPPPKIQAHFYHLLNEKYPNHNHIYTDGSVYDGKVGYGITNSSKSTMISSALPSSCSIFSAEAYALMKASYLSPSIDDSPTVVFSDSASCLREMNSSSLKHPWLQKAERLALDNRVAFCWLPGHSGITGNEEADRLAGAGREQNPEDVPVPPSDAVRWIKERIRDCWNLQWFNSRDFALRRIKPSTFPWPDNKNPKNRRILSRLRIGHTRLTHSYRITKDDPPNCPTCGVPLSIQHILIDCLKYDNERLTLNMSNTLEEVLSPPQEEKLIEFLKKSGLYNQL